MTAYIHNKPKNTPDFRDAVHSYYFSSFGIYLVQAHDDFGMINTDYILSQFAKESERARVKYANFVSGCNKIITKEKNMNL